LGWVTRPPAGIERDEYLGENSEGVLEDERDGKLRFWVPAG
jgi:hypothetical protein